MARTAGFGVPINLLEQVDRPSHGSCWPYSCDSSMFPDRAAAASAPIPHLSGELADNATFQVVWRLRCY